MKSLNLFSLCAVLSIFFGAQASWADCIDAAMETKKRGIHGVVVSFEGLASHGRGYVRNGLIKPTPSSLAKKFTSLSYPYTRGSEAANCLLDYYQVHGNRLAIFVIGHSFGAGIALFDFFESLPKALPIRGVISLDPRSWSSDSTYRKSRDPFVFSIQGYGKSLPWWNFYQTGSFRGYLVKGAGNSYLDGVSHTGLPKHEVVRNTYLKMLQSNL